ncbi:MAG: hypothetical protein ACYTG6_16600, partial [Planctomycetota bacterium]
MRVLVVSLVLLLLLPFTAALAPVQADGEGGAWPFGQGGGGPLGFRGRDLYNLGLLGAKASDPDAGPPPTGEPMPGGGRRFRPTPEGPGDEGPNALRIEVLFPRGPGEAAGLQLGDVIVGVGRSAFRDGSLGPLAEA